MNSSQSQRLIRVGQHCYGAGILGLGIEHFVIRDFVPVVLPSLPACMPLQGAWPYIVGLVLIAAGAAIFVGVRVRVAAVLLGFVFLAFLVLRHLPAQLASGSVWPVAAWNNPLKLLALAGGAFAVAASVGGFAVNRMDAVYTSFGCFALALTCALFGFEHFQYPQFVALLVPAWMPGHLFWTYFCGAALMAAGLGMLLRIQARLAAFLLGSMIFIWFLVLHIPRAVADPLSGKGNELASVFESLAFAGIGFILSQTLPKKAA
jgi:uncharacterized membrane protein